MIIMPITVNAVIRGWQEKNGLWNWTIGGSVSEIPIDMPLTDEQKGEILARMDEALNAMRSLIVLKNEEYRRQEFDAMHRGGVKL